MDRPPWSRRWSCHREAWPPSLRTSWSWWTFAGGAANTLLARMFERTLGGRVVARNTSLTLADKAGKSVGAIRECLRAWDAENRPNAEDARTLASVAAKTQFSKFEPCLPDAQLAELQMSKLFDIAGARRAVQDACRSAASRG